MLTELIDEALGTYFTIPKPPVKPTSETATIITTIVATNLITETQNFLNPRFAIISIMKNTIPLIIRRGSNPPSPPSPFSPRKIDTIQNTTAVLMI